MANASRAALRPRPEPTSRTIAGGFGNRPSGTHAGIPGSQIDARALSPQAGRLVCSCGVPGTGSHAARRTGRGVGRTDPAFLGTPEAKTVPGHCTGQPDGQPGGDPLDVPAAGGGAPQLAAERRPPWSQLLRTGRLGPTRHGASCAVQAGVHAGLEEDTDGWCAPDECGKDPYSGLSSGFYRRLPSPRATARRDQDAVSVLSTRIPNCMSSAWRTANSIGSEWDAERPRAHP